MVRLLKIFSAVLAIVICALNYSYARLIITEVMSNEPGSNTSLEWIEIYNTSSAFRPLGFCSIIVDTVTYYFTQGGVEGFSYAVVCKDTLLFESTWGDGSGTWGDNPEKESGTLAQLGGFNLVNGGGQVSIEYLTLESEFYWSSDGQDGVSWERIFIDSSYIGNSVDPSGSTPGRLNSLTPLDYDLALLPVTVIPMGDGWSYFEIRVANVGLQAVSGNILKVYHDLNADSIGEVSELISEIDYGATAPGDTIVLGAYFLLEGLYPDIIIELPDDNRLTNNRRLFKAFGVDYPPFIINEFIAYPQEGLTTEWVEIRNNTVESVDLKGWFIGDERDTRPIIQSEYIVAGGEYVVLCKDSAAFYGYYGSIEINLIQVSSWAALNNDNDIVRLKDNYGIVADSFIYNFTHGGNYSWGKSEDPEYPGVWGRSVEVGGSPGRKNEIHRLASGTGISVSVEPNPFSLSIDGTVNIQFSVPPGDNIVLKIYDTDGRIIKTLLDGVPPFDGSVDWNGRDEEGRRANVGIYILYMEVSGIDSHKQTIVVAP